jgi:hypothetical protein
LGGPLKSRRGLGKVHTSNIFQMSSVTGTRLILGLITPHRTNLTITKTRKGRPKPDPGCSDTDDDLWYV